MSERRLGPYRLLERLDDTVAGPVWDARDERDGATLRVVELTRWRELDPEAQAAGRARLERVQRIDSPRLLRVRGLSGPGEPPWVAYEPRAGRPLDASDAAPATDAASRGRVVELVADACECVGVLHEADVVHGGLRPSSFEFDARGRLRLDGAGLTLPEHPAVDDPGAGRTPAFLAPEQIRHETVDRRADLFAIGAIAYELLTGRRAFAGDTPESIVYRIVHEPIEPSGDEPGLTPALADVLRRALAIDRDARVESVEAFAADLRAAGAGLEVEVPRADTGAPAPDPVDRAPHAPPVRSRRRSRSSMPFVAVLVLGAAAVAAALWLRGTGSGGERPRLAPSELTTAVRTEPPGQPIRLDGIPLAADQAREVRFRAGGPYGTLSVSQACRTVEHTLAAEDAGGEIVLVVEPIELEWHAEPGVKGASVRLGDGPPQPTPATLTFDLCAEQRIELAAPDHRPVSATIPAGATPDEARALLAGLRPAPIPRGRVELPRGRVELVVYVDGRRQPAGVGSLTLDEGRHEIRLKNEFHWIDVTHRVDVRGGETIAADRVPLPALGSLVVQAYPANCEVAVGRSDGELREVGETPFERRVAVGAYRVRITWQATGERHLREVTIGAGENPPLRVAFGS